MSSPAKLSVTDTIRLVLFCLLPASLYFSYYPLISLGENTTMNFELSIPLIILFLFAFFSIPELCRLVSSWSWKKSLLIFAIPIYATISLCWTENILRGALTAGVLWCIFISIASIYELYSAKKCCKDYNTIMIYIYLSVTLLVCLFCLLQCILDVAGVDRGTTLLCPGCTSYSFGFPHPSGFAIEPQFMGNLLLFPSLLSLYGLLHFDEYFRDRRSRILALVFSGIVIFTLFITFSRGAIYSFVIAATFLLFYEKIRTHTSIIRPTIVVVSCMILSIISQGIMSEYSQFDSTFLSGVSSSISQLSLGIINIPTSQVKEHQEPPLESSFDVSVSEAPVFDGYVENSTDERLLLSGLAFSAWNEDYMSFALGHGLGSSGVVIHRLFPTKTDEKEIIQNELLAILLELGITGLIIVAVIFVKFYQNSRCIREAPLLYSVIIAFVVSLMFFSGLPNALHIYILPAILFLCLSEHHPIIDIIRNKHRR